MGINRLEYLQQIVSQISCEDYDLEIRINGNVYYLEATYMEEDILTGALTKQRTRPWMIVDWADEDDIVRTVLKCIITSHEHKVREHFLYKGSRIFSPHKKVL